ncbi:Calumenin-B isoform 3 [Schistosoma japonicum]|uniref:Reticulocalbin-3 n=1 Tax=Schistosoma japonicum TaxID=6182 RepID=A0A4Z2DDB7_SCHJA|nr:Calumenin-A [Schistosoma japonicum]TNN14449.1 Calumenin-B isoform 3 [Schistosoma japonicum]
MIIRMKMSFYSYVILITLINYAFTKPHLEAVSRRDTEHFADDPERHDIEFDHNAFLGEETAKEFSQLTPDESEEKLKVIIGKIDKNNDKNITESELKAWIEYIATKTKQNSTDRQWNDINPTNNYSIKWKEYLEKTYGPEEERLKDIETSESYKEAVRHDRRRWVAADLDKDDSLNKTEFADFVHPEDRPNMREAVIEELLESVDKDKDGYVSEKEYLSKLKFM